MSDRLKAAFTAWPYCLATYVALIGAAWLLFVPYVPTKLDPPIYSAGNSQEAAIQEAARIDGKVWAVSHTGSMKPLLQGGEYAVTVAKFDAVKRGQVLVYHAPYNKNPIIHRAVEQDKYGWLMAGDTAARSESWARVTSENYLGTVVAIYRNF
jgi:hypothetical protein